MSQENVEIVRRFLGALTDDDFDTALGCLHPDAEWHNTRVFPGAQTVVGNKAILEFWQGLVEQFDRQQGGHRIESVADGGDRVVVGIRSRGQGTGSGVPIDVSYALTCCIRDRRIERIDVSGKYERALEAAGLRA